MKIEKTEFLRLDSKFRATFGKFKSLLAHSKFLKVTQRGNTLIIEPIESKESDVHWLDLPENAHIKKELKKAINESAKGKVTSWDKLKRELSDEVKAELGIK